MSGNSGYVSLQPFKTKFQLAEGTRLTGMDPSMAGKKIEMNWNEAMLAQAQGFGEMDIGWRPHHTRPHLKGRKAPQSEPVGDGAALAAQRVSERIRKDKAYQGQVLGRNEAGLSASTNVKEKRKSGEGVRSNGAAIGTRAQSSSAGGQENKIQPAKDPGREPITRLLDEGKARDSEGLCYLGGKINSVPTSQSSTAIARKAVDAQRDRQGAGEPAPTDASGKKEAKKSLADLDNDPEAARWQAMKDTNDAIGGLVRARRLFLQRSRGIQHKSKESLIKIGPDVLYIGEVVKGVPHGSGCLILSNAQHVGAFQNGRAHGPGVYLTDGAACEGSWNQNKRVGAFNLVDGKGVTWTEKYNEEGGKIARKSMKESSEGDQVTVPQQCTKCPTRFHSIFNHRFACRSHAANLLRDPAEKEEPVWTCCGARGENAVGCDFGYHE